MNSRICIVEDDIYLREELVHTFEKKGYSVVSISSFHAPEQEICACHPDLLILDINLPGKSGFELCKWLKSRNTFPVLILTARDGLNDELYALGLGADDYLTKPCHPDRLLARAERLLSTYRKVASLLQYEGLSLDTDTYKVMWRDVSLILPETEGKLLLLLMENAPDLVSKQTLSDKLWGGTAYVDENILQVNMTRLRKKLANLGAENIIRTFRGQVYALCVKPDNNTLA